jgi:hypothetical protein
MMSLETDFETYANWQGYIEELAVKDFVARKAHTIALSKAQGTHWNGIQCKEPLGNHLEAVARQGTINLDSPVWKYLGDSLPGLYCVDLAEAFVMQESVSSRILCDKIRLIGDRPTDVCMRNLRRKVEWGKKTGTDSSTRFLRASCFEKMHDVCQKYGGACTT